MTQPSNMQRHQIIIVGGGAAGISVAASLLRRDQSLDIGIIEPSDRHFYQAAFTLVGAGCYAAEATVREEVGLIPSGVNWIRAAAARFDPDSNIVELDSGLSVEYEYLVVCPGLALNWEGIEGLPETIGKNNVSSNYLLEYARYTRSSLESLEGGRLLFTQPPMPIKCAGAPQKIMYLAANELERNNKLGNFDIEFHTATPALFGVADFVPPLMKYIERYGVSLNLQSNLVAIDGAAKKAVFQQGSETVEREFDFIHVVPPQIAPEFIRSSPFADEAGWFAVDQNTLRHTEHTNVYALGDVTNAPNAKTAAAVRKQVPVVCENVLAAIAGRQQDCVYDGYGACPLTVEHGKVVLAEFGYGGKLLPTFPVDNTRPSRKAWFLKRHLMSHIYWNLMLRGRETLIKPQRR